MLSGGTISMTYNEHNLLAPVRKMLDQTISSNSLITDAALSRPGLYVTPGSVDGHRAAFCTLELEKTIDSANATPAFWAQLAGIVHEHYGEYDGFVVVHGTDTLAYTASALSFMLQGLGKTVAMTGSQIPMPFMASDAAMNLIEAIWTAAHSAIPEVVIVFNHNVLRGNRTRKVSTSDMGSFRSANFPPLGQFCTKGLNVNRHYLLPPGKELLLTPRFYENVPVFKLIPRTCYEYVARQIELERAPGCVIEVYGSGTIPLLFEPILNRLVEQGIIIAIVSQVDQGNIATKY